MLTENKRPTCLKEIQGQPEATKFLADWLKKYKDTGTSDVFLITGPSGTGKTSIGHVLANELGVDFSFETVCSRKCDVDTVRGMQDWLQLAAFNGSRWKILLIDEAHTMSKPAQDAWLSILESLPNFRLIIFTTTEPTHFDLVWRSRCKLIELKKHSKEVLLNIMHNAIPGMTPNADGVFVNIAPATLDRIANCACGNARQALQELEKTLISTTPEDEAVIQQVTERLKEPANVEAERSCVPATAPEAVAPGVARVEAVEATTAQFTLRPSSTGRSGFIEVIFPSKPDEAIREELKRAEFRWSRFNQVWYGREAKLPARYKVPATGLSRPGNQCEERDAADAPTAQCRKNPQVVQEPKEPATIGGAPLLKASDVQTSGSPAIIPDSEPALAIQQPSCVPAECVTPPASAGLEIRLTVGKTNAWSVIHIGSGKAIGKPYQDLPSEEEATRLMHLALPLTDWTVGAAELMKVPGMKDKLIAIACQKPVENKPEPGKVYALTGNDNKCIAHGNTWAESEVKEQPKASVVQPPPALPQPVVEPKAAVAIPKFDFAAKLRALIKH